MKALVSFPGVSKLKFSKVLKFQYYKIFSFEVFDHHLLSKISKICFNLLLKFFVRKLIVKSIEYVLKVIRKNI